MIADFGSGGAEHDVPSLVVCGSDDIELGSRHVLVSASLVPQDILEELLKGLDSRQQYSTPSSTSHVA